MTREKLLSMQVLYAMQQGFRSKRSSMHEVCEAHDIGCGEIKRLYDSAVRRQLQKQHEDRLSKIDANGETPLHTAVRLRNPQEILNLVL